MINIGQNNFSRGVFFFFFLKLHVAIKILPKQSLFHFLAVILTYDNKTVSVARVQLLFERSAYDNKPLVTTVSKEWVVGSHVVQQNNLSSVVPSCFGLFKLWYEMPFPPKDYVRLSSHCFCHCF